MHIRGSEGLQALCSTAGSVRDQHHNVVTFSPKARSGPAHLNAAYTLHGVLSSCMGCCTEV